MIRAAFNSLLPLRTSTIPRQLTSLKYTVPFRPFTHHEHHGEEHGHKAKAFEVPPMPDVADLEFVDPIEQDIFVNPTLPFEIERTATGVTVLKINDEEVVVCHGVPTLEWAVPSPPPLHQMHESPIVKEHPPDFVEKPH